MRRKKSDSDTKQNLHLMQILTETFTDSTMVQKSGGGIVTKKLHEKGVQEIGQYDNDQEIGSINKQNTFVGHPNLSELRRNIAIFLLPPKRKLNLLRKISQMPLIASLWANEMWQHIEELSKSKTGKGKVCLN